MYISGGDTPLIVRVVGGVDGDFVTNYGKFVNKLGEDRELQF